MTLDGRAAHRGNTDHDVVAIQNVDAPDLDSIACREPSGVKKAITQTNKYPSMAY